MIITDLSYQEITAEANELEGGLDLSLNNTFYQAQASLLQSASTSGPGGSTSITNGATQKIDTAGFGLIVLGAP